MTVYIEQEVNESGHIFDLESYKAKQIIVNGPQTSMMAVLWSFEDSPNSIQINCRRRTESVKCKSGFQLGIATLFNSQYIL